MTLNKAVWERTPTIAMSSPADIKREANVFSRYLIGENISDSLVSRYEAAIVYADAELSPQDKKLMKLCLRRPWLTGFVDGGLSILNPLSDLRRRIYIMFAVLETSPKYAHHFLPQHHSPFYLVVLTLVGLRALFRTLVGVAVVKVMR